MFEILLLLLWWMTMVVLFFLALCIISVISIYWFHFDLHLSRCYANFPAIKLHPFISYWSGLTSTYRKKYPRAVILQIMACICKFFERERIALLWLGFRPIIFVFKPETAEILLNNSVTITKSAEYDILKPWLGTGLLTSSGKKWRSHRKLLTPAFHFQILDNFLHVFNEHAAILAKKLEYDVGKPWINVIHPVTMCTLDTICQTAMGVRLNSQSGECNEYCECINEISDMFIYRLFRPWLWLDPIFLYLSPAGWKFRQNVKRVHDFTKKVIKEKKDFMIRQNLKESDEESLRPKKKAFLELLLEHHLKDDTLTEEHIREEVDTFMFEGHDTTSMSICWTLYELGRHSDIQEKVFQELDTIFEGDSERDVTFDDLKEMKYLECVIKESLRLYPSVAFIARKLEEDLKVGKYTLKPGSTCFVTIFMLHLDPEQFPQPEIFDPDRFLPENNKKRHPFAYIPFSAGPRNCIGQKFALMELKTILVHVLRKFKITSLDPRDKLNKLAGLVLKSAEPIRINFELRAPNDPS